VLLRADALDAEAQFGAESIDSAVAWNRVGVAAKFAGRYDEAAAAYERVRLVAEAMLGSDPDMMATLLHNLGGLAHARCQFDEAEQLARRGLDVRRRSTADERDLAADVAAFAAILEGQERWAEAEASYREALALWRENVDEYEISLTLNGLGAVLRFSGRLAEAESMFEEALSILERVRSTDHPRTATVRNNLAMLHNAMGRRALAIALLERACADLETRLGQSHPATVDVRGNLDRVTRGSAGRE
jgi:tetratricopeptide (TPR) repeat protein